MPDPLPMKRPHTPEELAALVQTVADAGAHAHIVGSASLPLVRFNPERPVQTVSTLRMNKVLEHAVGDMVVRVEAGITLEALQKELAWRDQWLPVDAPGSGGRAPGGRTIGGMIATNSLGPLRMGLAGGDWRRLILGMRWVDASGVLLKGGGQTVKNVAGYSSPRMMIGSAGTLGAIAEVTLRTFARPADERCVIFYCESAARAEALLAEILLAACVPDYLQVVGGGTWAGNPLGLPATAAGGMVVVAGFLGRSETCAAQAEIVRRLEAAHGVESIAQTAAQAGRLRLWMTREPAARESGIGLRLHVASSQVAEMVAALEKRAAEAWVVSEAGSGVVRVVLGPAAREFAAELAQAHRGRVVITQGDLPPQSENPLVARLKAALDPRGVFGQLR